MNIHLISSFLIATLSAALLLLNGCIFRSSTEPGQKGAPSKLEPSPGLREIPESRFDPRDKPSFFTFGWKTDFSRHSVPYDEIISGGVPRDGIPPIYEPKFDTILQADTWLKPREPVAALEFAGEQRAYPLRILIWHEIVNDNLGGIPVALTYCPLCNTVVAFDRRVEGKTLIFGVSGLLRHSDLIMWDHQTESLWQQGTGEGIVGFYTGKLLDFLPSSIVSWQEFKATYPGGKVLSLDTGHRRNYGSNPYEGYDTSRSPFLLSGKPDPRLPAMERVVGVGSGDKAVAYPFSTLAQVGVVNDSAGDQLLVVFYQPGTVSALDESRIEKSRDVGAAAVFSPQVEGRKLNFEMREGKITDKETGSQWNILGKAIQGPLAGKELKPVVHGTNFWFSWAAFNPRTRIYQPYKQSKIYLQSGPVNI